MLLQHAKIYQIINSKGDRYIGSTTRKYLCQRMAEHVYNSKIRRSEGYNKRTCCSSNKIFDDTEFKIELLQDFPCNDKKDLYKREQFYISNLKGVVNLKRSAY